LRHAQGSVNG